MMPLRFSSFALVSVIIALGTSTMMGGMRLESAHGEESSSAPFSTVDFEKQVFPILEQRCNDCHKPKKTSSGRTRSAKGGLRLDGRGWIEHGVGGDPILVPFEAEKSLLYTLTVLPEDHDDFMPAKGEGLSDKQIETLKRWIEEGAEFGDWNGAPGQLMDLPPNNRPENQTKIRNQTKNLSASPFGESWERA